uniref:Uncharacterized protein n=1 Tax=Arundo donax TaxID=35708 RepID=A0A0A9F6X7_ARUDO
MLPNAITSRFVLIAMYTYLRSESVMGWVLQIVRIDRCFR